MKALLRPAWQAARRSVGAMRDQAMDWRLGIRTMAPHIDQADLDPHAERVGYDPLPYRALRLIDEFAPVDPDDVVHDIGCGMGRVLCHFARKPIAAVRGVEYDPALASAALRNAGALRGRRAPITIQAGDAAEAEFKDVTLAFMFNPFGAATMETVVGRLLDTAPGALRIVYVNPVQEAVVTRFPGLAEIARFTVPHDLGRAPVVVWSKGRSTRVRRASGP